MSCFKIQHPNASATPDVPSAGDAGTGPSGYLVNDPTCQGVGTSLDATWLNKVLFALNELVDAAGIDCNSVGAGQELVDAVNSLVNKVSPCNAPAASAGEIAGLTGNETIAVCIGGTAKAVPIGEITGGDDLPELFAVGSYIWAEIGVDPGETISTGAVRGAGDLNITTDAGGFSGVADIGVGLPAGSAWRLLNITKNTTSAQNEPSPALWQRVS